MSSGLRVLQHYQDMKSPHGVSYAYDLMKSSPIATDPSHLAPFIDEHTELLWGEEVADFQLGLHIASLVPETLKDEVMGKLKSTVGVSLLCGDLQGLGLHNLFAQSAALE